MQQWIQVQVEFFLVVGGGGVSHEGKNNQAGKKWNSIISLDLSEKVLKTGHLINTFIKILSILSAQASIYSQM